MLTGGLTGGWLAVTNAADVLGAIDVRDVGVEFVEIKSVNFRSC